MPIRIFIDQGHNPGGVNSGAIGNGLYEDEVNYKIGMYLADILNNDSRFSAITSRTSSDEILGTNVTTSLAKRVQLANDWNADYFISVHCNASENPNLNGTEAYVYQINTQPYYMGEDMVEAVSKRVGTKNNGIYENTSLYVLRRTKMPAVLMELGYLTNISDAQKLRDEPYQFAYGMYEGLLKYFGLKAQ